jgi:hypothetical protein
VCVLFTSRVYTTEKQSDQFLTLICDESLTCWSLNSNSGHSIALPLSLFCVKNHVCLSHSVQVTREAWRAVTKIVVGVGDQEQRTGDGQAQVGYSVTR